jgi:D-alanyl-D-alanine carboxypeptidase
MGYAPLKGNVLAKTGSLPKNGVHALSGYVRCPGGRVVAFSILFNKSVKRKIEIRRFEEKVVLAVYKHGGEAARLAKLVQ